MKRECILRSLSVSRELTVPCQYTEFQKQSVKINMEEKQRKRACLPRFKREPRTHSALPIHQISKAISENEHGSRRNRGNVHVYLVLSVNRELTVLCQITPNFKSKE